MSFEEAESYLDGLGIDAMKSVAPSLHRIEALCEALDHPERHAPAIHITGTNGKTSVARIATSLLATTGLSVGTYTSPHLQTTRERIALNGESVDEAAFGDVFDHVFPYLEVVEKELDEKLTYFELLTGMFFLWAAETPVDALVVEVGLGGRWDATNVVPSSVQVITNVSVDHTSLLGTDRVAIGKEKAGIAMRGSPFVVGERAPDVLAAIREVATEAGAEVVALGAELGLQENRVAFGGRYLSVATSGGLYEGLFLPLHGAHQGVNAALALEAVGRFVPARRLDHEVVMEGLGSVRAPGRLEPVRVPERPGLPVLLDVAHNPDGMSALVTSLAEAFAFERVVFVMGCLDDKDYDGMLSEMARVPCRLVLTRARSPRAIPIAVLRDAAATRGMVAEEVDEVPAAVDHAMRSAADDELVCITGSHYVVGDARSHLSGAGKAR